MSVIAKWSQEECEIFDSYDWKIDGDHEWYLRLMLGSVFEKEWTMTELVESLQADVKGGLSVQDIREKYRKHKKVVV
tara:strand:+ start:1088 stop:1318 length:231 start_codon:yes stop_codon:yes gene_type:complete